MTKLHPAVIEAARVFTNTECDPSSRARRVINAQAERMPEEAMESAWSAYSELNPFMTRLDHDDALQAAIAAFLKHCGEME